MRRFERELQTLREYLQHIDDMFRDVSNLIYRLETEIKLASRHHDPEGYSPQKKVRIEGCGIWEE